MVYQDQISSLNQSIIVGEQVSDAPDTSFSSWRPVLILKVEDRVYTSLLANRLRYVVNDMEQEASDKDNRTCFLSWGYLSSETAAQRAPLPVTPVGVTHLVACGFCRGTAARS